MGDSRSRTIESSVSKIADRHSAGVCIEATLAGEGQFHGGTRPSSGKPSGGVNRDTVRDTGPGRKTGGLSCPFRNFWHRITLSQEETGENEEEKEAVKTLSFFFFRVGRGQGTAG